MAYRQTRRVRDQKLLEVEFAAVCKQICKPFVYIVENGAYS